MANEMNHVRAMRLAEIVQEFRNLQHYINQIQHAAPPPTGPDAGGEGYVLLQQCLVQGKAVLEAPFDASARAPNGDPNKEREQLQEVILDASVRRFQAQGIYLRATAAMRWINSRNALKAQQAGPRRDVEIQRVDKTLQRELDSITDERVVQDLLQNDEQQGKWVEEDPDLETIQTLIASRN